MIVASARVQLGQWTVPLVIDGAEATLTGITSWLPAGEDPLADPGGGFSVPWAPILGVLLAAVLVVGEIRRRRGRPSPA